MILHHRELSGRHLNFAGCLFLVCALWPFKVLKVPGHHDAVIENLAKHTAGWGSREIQLALFAQLDGGAGGQGRTLVGFGEGDDVHQSPEIIATGDELLREEFECRWMMEPTVVGKIVERFDKAMPDKLRPNAVHESP